MKGRLPAVAAAVVALLLAGCGGPEPPAEDAAKLVPAERTLVYLHVSTDPKRDQDAELAERLDRLPSYRRLRDRILRAFSARLDFRRDVRPWLGREVGFALLDNGTAQANTLLLAAVADRAKAEAFLGRVAGRREPVPYRRVVLRRFGDVAAAFVGKFLAVGHAAAVRLAIDREQGTGAPLADLPAYRRATAGRPAGRTVDAWIAPGGVRRVLRPQGGLLGLAGSLVDHPRLVAVSATLAARDDGVRATVRVARDGAPAREFEPEQLSKVPKGAALYAGLAGLDAAAGLLPGAGAAGLLEQLRAALPATAGIELDRDLLGPLRGEVALSLTPGLLTPTATLVAATVDERRTREVMARLQLPLAQALAPGAAGVPAALFEPRRIAGVDAYALAVAPGFTLTYAVFDGRLVVSTAPGGIERVRSGGDRLADSERFRATVGDPPSRAQAILFCDFGPLLALADLAGLTSGPAFTAVRDDVRRIRAAGAVVTREKTDSTAELSFEIP